MADGNRHNGERLQHLPVKHEPDSTPIHRLVQSTRRWLRSSWIATGLGLTIGLFLIILLAVALADIVMPLWPSLRLIALIVVVIPVATVFFTGVLRPLLRRLSSVLVARRIEQELPGIHNRLVSCVDFSEKKQTPFQSQVFYRRLINETLERIREFRLQSVLDYISLRRAGLLAMTGSLVFMLAYVLFSDRLTTATARIFQPFADIPPVTGVLYDVLVNDQTEPGDYEVLRGEPVRFQVTLTKGEVDPPGGNDSLRLKLNTLDSAGKAKTLWYQFPELKDRQATLELSGLQNSFTYRVYGGGTWTRLRTITMLERPKIVSLKPVLHYPAYMKIPEPEHFPPETIDVTGPIGSEIEVIVEAEGDAVEGEIQLLEKQTKRVQVHERPERIWFRDVIPQGVKPLGKWKWEERKPKQKLHTTDAKKEVRLHGFSSAENGFEVLPGEVLFADVYLDPDKQTESLSIKWTDEIGTEYLAHWGPGEEQAEKLMPGRFFKQTTLPASGKLVRLEVPARLLNIAGRRLHGIRFTSKKGNCAWGAVGTQPAAYKEVTELVVQEAFLLKRLADTPDKQQAQIWSGIFPLHKSGYYRVELRNKLQYPNGQMQEGKLTALQDEPPQVVINRPNKDLVLSKPIKVPITLAAYDDYGLDQIVLSVQQDEASPFQGRPVKLLQQPVRTATEIVTLDLLQEELAIGQTLRYRVEVRDTKGQSATTRDFLIRLANDNNAADKKQEQIEQQTESVQEKLEQLEEDQAKVQQAVQELKEKYEPLTEQIEQAKQAAAQELKQKADPENKPSQQPTAEEIAKQMKLEESAEKELQELKQSLQKLAQQEEKNAQQAQQIANELKQLAKQAPESDLLPKKVAKQLQKVDKAFDKMAAKPLQDLKEMLKQNAQPDKKDPQLAKTEQKANLLQQNLKDIAQRMKALAKAQQQSRDDAEKALAELKKDLAQQNAKMTARELAELKKFLKDQRKDLDQVQKKQQDLLKDSTKEVSKQLFEKLKEAQQDVKQEAKQELAETKKLLDSKPMKNLRKQLDANNPAQAPEKKKGDNDPQQTPNKPAQQPEKGKQAKPNSQSDSEFKPALGGPAPKPDPQIEKQLQELQNAKQARGKAQPAEKPAAASKEREEVLQQQLENAKDLDLAEKALATDQKTIENQMEKLNAATAEEKQAENLQQLLKSDDLREAQAMHQRMQELAEPSQQQSQDQQQASLPTPSQNEEGLLVPTDEAVEQILLELDDFDLKSKYVIMKMQPREREDLLQGLREQGPEGYRKFIRDYFRRLTKINENSKK